MTAGFLRADLARLVVSTDTAPRYAEGRIVVSAGWQQVPDEPLPNDGDQFTLIPYHDWGQAGLCTMRVWLPEA